MKIMYKKQNHGRYISGLQKLSLLLVMMLFGFSTVWAQSYDVVKVSDHQSLIRAIDNSEAPIILLQEGYYEHLQMNVAKGETVYYFVSEKGGGYVPTDAGCKYSITSDLEACGSGSPITLEVIESSGTGPCGVTGIGWQQISGPGTVNFDLTPPNTLKDFV